jgi:hypothetical protein
MGPIGSPENSASKHLAPRKNPEYVRIQFNGGGSLRSRNWRKSELIEHASENGGRKDHTALGLQADLI